MGPGQGQIIPGVRCCQKVQAQRDETPRTGKNTAWVARDVSEPMTFEPKLDGGRSPLRGWERCSKGREQLP